MKNIFSIMKKELLRVFKSKRMLIALLLPGLLIFVMYSAMGSAIQKMAETEEGKAKADTYVVYTLNLSEGNPLSVIIEEELEYDFQYTAITATEVNEKLELVKSGEADLVLVFDEDFFAKVEAEQKPEFMAYYNPYITKSAYAFTRVFGPAVTFYKEYVISEVFNFDTEIFTPADTPVFDENKADADMFAMMLPMLMLVFLFTGCVAVTPESIAGEKERGTIATLLATPVKRGEIAIGKITALSILAIISGLSSFIGLMASLPKLMGTSSLFAVYSFVDILLLFLVIMSTVLVIVGAMAMVSSFSKNIKEATMLITPFMMLGVVVGMLAMFFSAPTSFLFYLIPLYNTVAAISSILTFKIVVVNLAVTVLSNIVYVAAFVWVLTKIFNSEKVMFSK